MFSSGSGGVVSATFIGLSVLTIVDAISEALAEAIKLGSGVKASVICLAPASGACTRSPKPASWTSRRTCTGRCCGRSAWGRSAWTRRRAASWLGPSYWPTTSTSRCSVDEPDKSHGSQFGGGCARVAARRKATLAHRGRWARWPRLSWSCRVDGVILPGHGVTPGRLPVAMSRCRLARPSTR